MGGGRRETDSRGTVVEGPIVSLADFGAFVELGEGIEGMIHIGDISREKRLNHPKEALTVGQRVRAQVLEVDRAKRRIRLGMKQLEPTSIDEYIAEHKAGDTVSGRLVECSQKKIKVELGEGVVAICRRPVESKPEEQAQAAAAKADHHVANCHAFSKMEAGRVVCQGRRP